ncbi:hypothetical protein Scel_67670 [Streptomyces cellostaticus]|nr:hypothetical protein Scel_67670 [Streptomyces cellostaticus]
MEILEVPRLRDEIKGLTIFPPLCQSMAKAFAGKKPPILLATEKGVNGHWVNSRGPSDTIGRSDMPFFWFRL